MMMKYPTECLFASCRQLLNHLLDLVGAGFEVGVDLLQRAWRRELIEVAVERNLEADDADAAIQLVALVFINLGVRYVGLYLTLKVVIYRFTIGHVLVIAQTGIRLGVAVFVQADIGVRVALRKRIENGLLYGRAHF